MKNRIMPLIALTLAQPALAAVPDVVQPGDRDMACPALATAINDLAAQPAPAVKKRHSFLKVLGTAATFMPGVALVKGAALMSAAGAAQAGLAQAGEDRPAPIISDADVSAASARRMRLTALYDAKKC